MEGTRSLLPTLLLPTSLLPTSPLPTSPIPRTSHFPFKTCYSKRYTMDKRTPGSLMPQSPHFGAVPRFLM